jgi:hypothetical protein
METFPVDIDPEQIVRWIIAEQRAAPSTFRITASRATEARDIPIQKELRLGDEEREDLTEVATVATLEIVPFHSENGWRLTIVAEDEVGPRASATTASLEDEMEIDLDTFYEDFILSGRGILNVTVEVDSSSAKARVTRMLEKIEIDAHGHGAA